MVSWRPQDPETSVAPTDDLPVRLDALEDARTLLHRHGIDGADEDAEADGSWLAHARSRLRHGTAHTVVALAGTTGSGKSTLLNALVGEPVARAGVIRPTTAVAQAVSVGLDADGLLDLIGVSRRHHLDGGEGAGLPDGLVLLDLPDFDSVQATHRMEVDRLIGLVDLLVWVTDPQKYADESLHHGYLQQLSGHRDVVVVVLNQIDTVEPDQRQPLVDDLGRLLGADGLEGLEPITTTALTADGVAPLRAVLHDRVADRTAALDRIAADLRQRVDAIIDHPDAGGTGDGALPATLLSDTVDGLARAAGIDRTAALVAAQHRRDAALTTGWPPLRSIRRLRRTPMSRLETTAGNQVATAEVSRTLRSAGSSVNAQLGSRWGRAARDRLREGMDDTVAALDRTVSTNVEDLRTPPRWWAAAGVLHTLLLGTALLGAVWLVALLAVGTLLLVDPEPFTPRVVAVPVPTVMLVGGLVGGLLLAGLARLLARTGANRRRRQAVDRLRRAVEGVAADHVIGPIDAVTADRRQVIELLAIARGAARS